MKCISRIFLSVLAVALACSFSPVAAFADLVSEPEQGDALEAIEVDADAAGADEQEDAAVAEGDMAEIDAEASDVAEEGEPELSEPQELDSAELLVADAGEEDPNDSLDFLYVAENLLAAGETQDVAFALADESAAIESAELELESLADGTSLFYESSACAGNAAAFSFSFDESQMGAYAVTRVAYTLAGSSEAAIADFTVLDEEAGGCFEVVSAELAEAVRTDDNEDVSYYVLDDEGDIEVADTMDEAIQIADAEGVAESHEGDEDFSPLSFIRPLLSLAVASTSGTASYTNTRENYLIVAINAGHGGWDSGAVGNGLKEKDLALKIANYMKTELATYTGVTPYMVRASDTYVGLEERVERAQKVGADVFVSLHLNSSNGNGTGAEVWIPNTASYNASTHTVGLALGSKIAQQLKALGLTLRGNAGAAGVKVRNSESGAKYPDGSVSDYYSDIRNSRLAGFPGIIVEHAFVDNKDDAAKLKKDSFLKQLGVADATGVAKQYNLGKASSAKSTAQVQVRAHSARVGWESVVYENKVAGTTGKKFRLEALQLTLLNAAANCGGITYRAKVGGSWQAWKSNGATAGTTGQGKAIEAVQVKLTSTAASRYDVYYRTHVTHVGWTKWTKNGATSGSADSSEHMEAVEVAIVTKNGKAPTETNGKVNTGVKKTPSISYSAHVATKGWMAAVKNGATAGTTGQSLRLEALKPVLDTGGYDGGLSGTAHVQSIGWTSAVGSGKVLGTTGQSKRVEAITLKLTGDIANYYDIYYRVHAQSYGWMGWAKNGAKSGTSGLSKRVEAVQIKLVAKGAAAPGSTTNAFVNGTPIMGTSKTTVAQMVRAYNSFGKPYPASVYKNKGAATINDFCTILYEEANAEGVRAEVVFAQAMLETGWLQYGGDVKASQCNFAGLGATGGGVPGETFPNVRTGLRAQVQHLKAYASTASLKNTCVDTRFTYVTRGCATTVEALSMKWAMSSDYGKNLVGLINTLLAS